MPIRARTRVGGQPPSNLNAFARRVVVHHQMRVLIGARIEKIMRPTGPCFGPSCCNVAGRWLMFRMRA